MEPSAGLPTHRPLFFGLGFPTPDEDPASPPVSGGWGLSCASAVRHPAGPGPEPLCASARARPRQERQQQPHRQPAEAAPVTSPERPPGPRSKPGPCLPGQMAKRRLVLRTFAEMHKHKVQQIKVTQEDAAGWWDVMSVGSTPTPRSGRDRRREEAMSTQLKTVLRAEVGRLRVLAARLWEQGIFVFLRIPTTFQ